MVACSKQICCPYPYIYAHMRYRLITFIYGRMHPCTMQIYYEAFIFILSFFLRFSFLLLLIYTLFFIFFTFCMCMHADDDWGHVSSFFFFFLFLFFYSFSTFFSFSFNIFYCTHAYTKYFPFSFCFTSFPFLFVSWFFLYIF